VARAVRVAVEPVERLTALELLHLSIQEAGAVVVAATS
jgi:hypothetical protein